MNHPYLAALLRQQLLLYLVENFPDVIQRCKADDSLDIFLQQKIDTVKPLMLGADGDVDATVQLCMEVLNVGLGPSRYRFVCSVLLEECSGIYKNQLGKNVFQEQALQILEQCGPLFDALHFGAANLNNRLLRYAVAGTIINYFDAWPPDAPMPAPQDPFALSTATPGDPTNGVSERTEQ